jgi:hypothetical protein
MPYKSKAKRSEWNRNRNSANRKELDELKSKPCVDCGGMFPPWIMEFDHVPDRGKKVANISCIAGSSKMTSSSIQRELEKCDLVCANCHRTRMHFRKQDKVSLLGSPDERRPHKAVNLAGSIPAVGTTRL